MQLETIMYTQKTHEAIRADASSVAAAEATLHILLPELPQSIFANFGDECLRASSCKSRPKIMGPRGDGRAYWMAVSCTGKLAL